MFLIYGDEEKLRVKDYIHESLQTNRNNAIETYIFIK